MEKANSEENPIRLGCFAMVFAALVVIFPIFYPVKFAVVTIMLCSVLFVRHYRDVLVKERECYSDGKMSGVVNFFFWIIAALETLVSGVMAGFLPVISFSGSYSDRVVPSAVIFAVLIVLFTWLLYWLKGNLCIRPLQWGMLRLALPAGICYSVMVKNFVPSQPLSTAIGKIEWKDFFYVFWTSADDVIVKRIAKMPYGELAELGFSMKESCDSIIEKIIIRIFGETWGGWLHFVFSIDISYGIPICAFSVIIVIIYEKLFGNSIQSKATRMSSVRPNLSQMEAFQEVWRDVGKSPSDEKHLRIVESKFIESPTIGISSDIVDSGLARVTPVAGSSFWKKLHSHLLGFWDWFVTDVS